MMFPNPTSMSLTAVKPKSTSSLVIPASPYSTAMQLHMDFGFKCLVDYI